MKGLLMAYLEENYDHLDHHTRSSYANHFLHKHMDVLRAHDAHTADGQSLHKATITALQQYLASQGVTSPGYDSPTSPKQGKGATRSRRPPSRRHA